tara:strand:+ start:684 stop:1001 length:318 start_codon:yes stop_codon:yes gene_type:complete
MAVYENFTRITTADTWTKVAEATDGFTLDFEYIVTNFDVDKALISFAVAADDTDPAADTEYYASSDTEQYGTVTGSELLGPERALYVKSDQTDARIRVTGVREAV